MTVHGAASLPSTGGSAEQPALPEVPELRHALRMPDLPAPAPRDVAAAARRAADLVHADRPAEARALVEAFRRADAPAPDRIALLRAGLASVVTSGDREGFDRFAAELIAQLRAGGHAAQAEATVAPLSEHAPGPARGDRDSGAAVAPSARNPARGRRRGPGVAVPAELRAVVAGLELAVLPAGGRVRFDGDDRAGLPDPRRSVELLRTALEALPAAREQVLGEVEPLLRVRLAQALEGVGDADGASSQALDVLEALDQRAAEQRAPVADPQRVGIAARAVLARTLGSRFPLHAVRHALDALEALHDIDDPPLRIGLITDLLQALMHAGATAQASFTAGRLLPLQRTLDRPALRTAPLLAVAAQRMHAQRYEAAMVPLDQARAIACEQRDRSTRLEAARLAASIHERTGDPRAALVELRRMATDARWLADDLATPAARRPALVRTELEAQALVMRRALDLEQTATALAAARSIERRARPEGGRPLLSAELLWDHRVDARVGAFIAVGASLVRGEAGADRSEYDVRRREAVLLIDEVPTGHDARARYWATYLDDRHAELLAAGGRPARALRAARRARDGWSQLESPEDVARLDALVARLENG